MFIYVFKANNGYKPDSKMPTTNPIHYPLNSLSLVQMVIYDPTKWTTKCS